MHNYKLHIIILIVFNLITFSSCKTKQNQQVNVENQIQIAPDFSLNNLSGQKKTLIDYKGNIVLLNFWATWCPPCIAELPSLNAIAKKYKDRGLRVVAINCDSADELEKVKKMQSDNSYEFEVLLDPEISTPPKYDSTGFPESFFIGKENQFLTFNDPETKQKSQRIISERQWDSIEMQKSIEELLTN